MPEVEQAPRIPFSLGKNPDFEVLYEDQDSIAILKPSGIPSVPGILEPISMKSVLEEKTGPLYTVHRLDQGTSGVLLFAKNAAAAASLSDAFASRLTRKTYTAISRAKQESQAVWRLSGFLSGEIRSIFRARSCSRNPTGEKARNQQRRSSR